MGQTATVSPGAHSGAPTSGTPSHRGQRKLRNFLLDRHFQLKYSGYLVGVALFLSVSLGLILWRTSRTLVAQSRSSVALGEEIVERGRNLLAESEKVNAVVRMNIVETYADDPALLEVFQGEAAKRDGMLEQSQKQLEDNSQTLRAKSQMIEREYMIFGAVIVSALLLLTLGIGMAGIIVTHKVAGPVFKMKKLLRELAKSNFRVDARLRKGDELQHFFDAFNETVAELRQRQQDEIDQVESVLELLRDAESGATDPVIGARERLQALHASMRVSVVTTPPQR
jgi:nitrogen fixation/metabolism regulation signal transduction histidine kinase